MCMSANFTKNFLPGIATDVIGAIGETTANNRMLDYQAGVASLNATVNRYAARDAYMVGSVAESRRIQEAEQAVGKQKAAAAGGGVSVGAGSPAAMVEQETHLGLLDALMIRYNASKEAWGHTVAAEGYDAQASAYRKSKQSPLLSGFSTFLSGYGDYLTVKLKTS